jgi:hypothetical protein
MLVDTRSVFLSEVISVAKSITAIYLRHNSHALPAYGCDLLAFLVQACCDGWEVKKKLTGIDRMKEKVLLSLSSCLSLFESASLCY